MGWSPSLDPPTGPLRISFVQAPAIGCSCLPSRADDALEPRADAAYPHGVVDDVVRLAHGNGRERDYASTSSSGLCGPTSSPNKPVGDEFRVNRCRKTTDSVYFVVDSFSIHRCWLPSKHEHPRRMGHGGSRPGHVREGAPIAPLQV
jgi:hypothetical protein